jgi:hypothetical protein
MSKLRKLACRIFEMARNEVWLGGKGNCRTWPGGMEDIRWGSNVTWTLSPEVTLGGIRLRVCVSWDGNTGELYGDHMVRVFVDGGLKYPGGKYKAANRKGWLLEHRDAWSWKIARDEKAEGGKTSRISARGDLLKEAKEKIKGVRKVKHVPDHICPECGTDLADGWDDELLGDDDEEHLK